MWWKIALMWVALWLPFSAHAEEWRFALEELSGSVQDQYAQEFKRRIEAKTNGEVTVTIYPVGTLGTAEDVIELVAIGAIKFAHASPGNLGTMIPETQVFLVPYLLSQDNSVNKALFKDSKVIYGQLGNAYAAKGLQLLAMYPEGEMVWTTNRLIRTPEDFQNFKMRVMTSPMLIQSYQDFGASPTPLPFGEVYGGLQLGQIDGQENPVFAIEEMKFYEVQSHMIWPGHQQFTTSVVANNVWFDAQPEARKTLIRETMQELTEYIFPVQQAFAEQRLATIRERNPELQRVELNAAERAAFRKASMKTREAFVAMTGEAGQAVLSGLIAEIAALEAAMDANGGTLPPQ